MFHAVIESWKTQTRRIVNIKNDEIISVLMENTENMKLRTKNWKFIKPRYNVGETVYLKEPYSYCNDYLMYKFDDEKCHNKQSCDYINGGCEFDGWENTLFMPEKYARYFIEITGVKCERLHDISDEDCIKECIEELDAGEIIKGYRNYIQYSSDNGITYFETPQEAFAALIDKINGKDTWDSNPYVWVYDFVLKK